MITLPITTNLRTVVGFSAGTSVPSTNATVRHDIPGILLKISLNIKKSRLEMITKVHYK